MVFSNNVQYTYVKTNNSIYRNKVKICKGVDNCSFETSKFNDKDIVKVNISIGGRTRNVTYTLK